eukprot:111206-Rhodomonas_salina.1
MSGRQIGDALLCPAVRCYVRYSDRLCYANSGSKIGDAMRCPGVRHRLCYAMSDRLCYAVFGTAIDSAMPCPSLWYALLCDVWFDIGYARTRREGLPPRVRLMLESEDQVCSYA